MASVMGSLSFVFQSGGLEDFFRVCINKKNIYIFFLHYVAVHIIMACYPQLCVSPNVTYASSVD